MKKKLNNYVSEADKFLKNFDYTHSELSPSQLEEISRDERVSKLRDNPQDPEQKSKLWEEF